MRIRLNLSTAPAQTQRRFAVSTGLMGALAVLGLVVFSFQTYTAWHRERDHRQRMAQLNAQAAQLLQQRQDLQDFFARPEAIQLRDRAAFLNALIEQRSFPWTKLFMDLERILPEGVHVITIAPRRVGDRVEVKIVVGAASDETKLKFLRALEDSKEFSRIQLVSEIHPIGNQAASDLVRLELLTWYVTA